MHRLLLQRRQREVETVWAFGDVQGVYCGVDEFEGALPSLQEEDRGDGHQTLAEHYW